MTWAEAFKKAIAATGWMLIFLVIFGVITGIGLVLGVGELYREHASVGPIIAGWILMVIGYIGLIFGGLAITFKFLSEAVTETMMKRLYPPSSQPQSPPQPPAPAK